MRLLFTLLVCLTFQAHVWAQSHDEKPIPELADFLGVVDFWGAEMSPTGRYLSGVRTSDKGSFLITIDLGAPAETFKATNLNGAYLNWVEWINDERLLVSFAVYINYRTGKRIEDDDWDDLPNSAIPVRITRVAAMDRDGSNIVSMFGDDRRMERNFYLGGVVSFLPEDEDHILMQAKRGRDLDLFKVNVSNGEFERIASGTPNTFSWYVDREGEPAFRFNTNRRGTVIYIYAREDRANGKIKWRKIKTIRLKQNKSDESATEFSPLSPGPTETTYYVAARPEGEDRTGIYLYDFEADEFLETIKTDDKVDIEHGIFNRETREYQGVHYYRDRLISEFVNPDIQKHIDGLKVYFGDAINVFPLMSNKDGSIWLLKTVGPTDPGTYHSYDLNTAKISEIGTQKVDLSRKRFGEARVVDYFARDGLELNGYLTRPADVAEGVVPPLIMMPHGGPEVRDVITFDYMVQVLVSKGYQVFQPNFRGSSGFGKQFADLGRRQWGRAMQTDVDDAFAHLVDAGLAEADRACILGSSYGGYVALAATTLTPDLYQCAISIAGPSDLIKTLKRERKEEGRDSESYKYWVSHIGDPRKDKDALSAVSPALLAHAITRPVLLIHGKDDGVVPIEQSEFMAEAMDEAGKTYEMVVLEESAHTYRSDPDEKLEYESILAFLGQHLPISDPVEEANAIAAE